MTEHRLIEKMLKVAQIRSAKATEITDTVFIEDLVDFFRTYADRTHHGKEEQIMFRELANKPLTDELKLEMEELVHEHEYARQRVGELDKANEAHRLGDSSQLPAILTILNDLATFYPLHIQREDQSFFPDTEPYLSEEEQKAMLHEFEELDRRMIHEKYQALVRTWQSRA